VAAAGTAAHGAAAASGLTAELLVEQLQPRARSKRAAAIFARRQHIIPTAAPTEVAEARQRCGLRKRVKDHVDAQNKVFIAHLEQHTGVQEHSAAHALPTVFALH
jgi:hypothetical protein